MANPPNTAPDERQTEMNLLEPIAEAVELGWDIVCAPQVYQLVRNKVLDLERARNKASIASGQGPSMQRPIDVEWHAKQQDPVLLVFDDRKAARAHLDMLNR